MTGRQARWLTVGSTALLVPIVLLSGGATASGATAGGATAGGAGAASAAARGAAAGGARADAGGLKIRVGPSLETSQGVATTQALPGDGGDYVHLSSLGMVGVSTPGGRTVWQVQPRTLFADWGLSFTADDGPVAQDPEVPLVRLSPNPFKITSARQDGVADMHPEAAGYLAGSRVPVVAVSEAVGVTVGSDTLQWPVDVRGSRLHEGSFVTVFDARTGRYLYSQLYPGYVTQLVIAGGQLVVGDETGYPGPGTQMGAWRSATSVRALSFTWSGRRLVARKDWSFNTGAPWAALLDMQQVGSGVAVEWSDTPVGLGVPGPPDGHVLLIEPDGSIQWNVATSGYPILASYDASRQLLAVAEETDPTVSIGYTLAGLRVSDGSVAVSVPVTGSLPTALTVGGPAGGSGGGAAGRWSAGSTWYTAGVDTTPSRADGVNFTFTAGQVSAVDPGAGRVLWSDRMTGRQSREPYPVTLLASGAPGGHATLLVASGTGLTGFPSPKMPVLDTNDLRALSAADGQQLWDRKGNIADALSVRLAGPWWRPWVSGITDDQTAISYDLGSGAVLASAPLMGDMDAAVRADVNGQPALIVGSQSGGVFALDASDLSRVLWQTWVGGPVHQIVLARPVPGGPPVLVIAATTRVAVLAVNTGQARITRHFPGQYAWNVAVGRIGSHRAAVVVATDHLTAFDAGTGQPIWTYQPATASYFSNAAIVDGVTVAEYQNQVAQHVQPTTMAAIGIGPSGSVAWTAPASPSTTSHADLWNGVFAGPGIPAAGSTGVALSWQDTGGMGEVDVRDAATGKLLYSNVSGSLGNQQGWTVDPALGLIAIGSNAVVISPGGPAAVSLNGTSAAVVDSAGKPVFLLASNMVNAYPGATLAGLGGLPAATNYTFTPGTLVPMGPGAGGEVIALPQDLIAYEVVAGTEEGVFVLPFSENNQAGVDLLKVTGTPPAATVPRRAAPPRSHPRPTSLAVGGAPQPGMGTARPQLMVKVHGYTRRGTAILTQTAPAGYDPAIIRSYLGLSGTGAGQTVAVVDAYSDPRIVSDVNTFSTQFGLPKVCGTKGAGSQCFDFTVSAPNGTAGRDPDWALETSLDIEWIHAVAPRAAVRLVEAHDSTFAALFSAVTGAAALRPDAISMSWGIDGEFSGETYYDRHCELAHSVCVVASGDYGYPGDYPAYSPRVLAVGGTTLQLAPGGAVSSEISWDGSGGGQSYFEPKSAAQEGVSPGTRRGIPDVSFDADPSTGVAVYDTVPYEGQTGWFQVGGTSVGAPVWSAILASADQLRAAAGKGRLTSAGDQAARAVYAATSALGDITTGPPNGACPKECMPGPGWDFVTGLGSPRTGIDAAIAGAP
jgi:PQQ-like domain